MPLNNENNNECCKCTTPEYELILNEQGPQGRQGEKGNDGFSPTVTVNTNTDQVYSLTITTADGQIVTPNLKASVPGTGTAGQVLTKNSDTPYDMSFQSLPQAQDNQAGIVQLATEDDLEPDSEGEIDSTKAVTPDLLVNEVDKINTALEGYVTLDTNQTITGDKNFQGSVSLSDTRFSNQNNILMPNRNNYSGGFQVWDLVTEGNFNPQLINANAEKDSGEYPGFGFLGNNPENIQITDNKYKNAIGVDLYGQSSHPLITIKNGVLGDIIDSNDIATTSKAGIVKPDGTTITIDTDGTLHGASTYSLPTASATTLGGIKVGENLSITEDGTLSSIGGITEIPQATATALGGIKANEKDDTDTQEVKIDPATGLLYTKAGGGNITSINGGGAESTDYITYYTVVGNPTISEDFIMTLNQNGYITLDYVPDNFTTNDSFTIEFDLFIPSTTVTDRVNFYVLTPTNGASSLEAPQIRLVYNLGNTSMPMFMQIQLPNKRVSSAWYMESTIEPIDKNNKYHYKTIYNPNLTSNRLQSSLTNDSGLVLEGYMNDASKNGCTWTGQASIGKIVSADTIPGVTIDLKTFKITRNNNLDYQAVQIL